MSEISNPKYYQVRQPAYVTTGNISTTGMEKFHDPTVSGRSNILKVNNDDRSSINNETFLKTFQKYASDLQAKYGIL